jgi:hypothetical protein
MDKLFIVFFLFNMLTGCNILNREERFNSWKQEALEYNNYIRNNCKHSNDICESDYKLGNLLINNFEFNEFRKKIIDSCLNINNGDFLIMEKSGSGEVYYYLMYIFDLSNQKLNKRFKYISNNEGVKLTDIHLLLETSRIDFINELDYVKIKDSINWGESPRTLGINFVSYTSIKNGKIKFVKFIPKPIAAAELQF